MKDWELPVVIVLLFFAAIVYFDIPLGFQETDDGECRLTDLPCSYILDEDGNQIAVGEDGERLYPERDAILRGSTPREVNDPNP